MTPRRTILFAALALAAAGCGGAASTDAAPASSASRSAPAAVAASMNFDWPTFGLNAARSAATNRATGITAGNVGSLHRHQITVPGTVDSAPIYLHGVTVAGARRDVFVVATTYGRTIALDANSGRSLWTFTPPGYSNWANTAQITNATPTTSSDRAYVYSASPDGRIHKLRLANGAEARGWPVSITRDARHEKITPALLVLHGAVLAETGGYIGDAPPYQGHVVAISEKTGRILHVFNSLCSNRRSLQRTSTCGASDSAILSRAGVVLAPGDKLLTATGNAPFDGRTNWGDSALMLDARTLRLVRNFTPVNQAQLNASDTDLGSSVPAVLPGGYASVAGKDGKIRLLRLAKLNGRTTHAGPITGGDVQILRAPGGADVFTQPAVWRRGRATTVFYTTFSGTAAFSWRGHRLHPTWSNGTPGTSPIVAGGLLYVYDPGGSLVVYRPGSGRVVARLDTASGHWNSPIVGGGRILVPEGNANDHRSSGTLSLYTRG